MRSDLAGMFWDDTPPPKEVKEIVKRTPPPRTWEEPGYLPHLEEALALRYAPLTLSRLSAMAASREPLIYDVEVYPNFFFVSFTDYHTGASFCFEWSDGHTPTPAERERLAYCFGRCLLVGFNSLAYDSNIVALALAGYEPADLQKATTALITFGERPEDVLKAHKVIKPQRDEIDLIEVCPLNGSLKTYGGRLHCPQLQDLPFPPGTRLTPEQMAIVRWYNLRCDIVNTAYIYRELQTQLQLRASMSQRYNVDVRSKSDAQIAEAVIGAEMRRLLGQRIKRPEIKVGHSFKLRHEPYIQFQTPMMQGVYAAILAADFVIDVNGNVAMPEVLKDLELAIGRQRYRMGIGGLHSTEQKQVRRTDAHGELYDRDVASYYPRRILNVGMYPKQLGPEFLHVYASIVEERLRAKAAKQKDIAESLKIVVNGTFGKTLSPWSIIYAPEMGIQVTVGGQLCLLMLIEALELAGIEVMSANTDGITCYVPNGRHAAYVAIVAAWEAHVGLETEETPYAAMYSRDVNNYMAVKMDGKVKCKGAYLNAYKDKDLAIFRFHKNPVNTVCIEALEQYLVHGVPFEATIRVCKDMSKFITLRSVRGGGVKDGEYLGKTVRWYYGTARTGEIVYASSGNKVPRSDGAVPCMGLPATLPADLDFDWYIREADNMLQDFGLPSTLPTKENNDGD